MNKVFTSMLQVFLLDKSATKFAWGVLVGFSFSISVILSTVGIMDGFVESLKMGLKRAEGDILVHSHEGFFKINKRVEGHMNDLGVVDYTGIVQTEGFLIYDQISKGVLVKGIEPESFKKVTGIDLKLGEREIALGLELSKFLKVKVGEEIVLAFANGNKDFSGLPLLQRYKVKQLIDHKIYQKDMRLTYMVRSELQQDLILENKINVLALNIPSTSKTEMGRIDDIKNFIDPLLERLGFDYTARPFWREYASLIEAVQVEKFMISLILQLIVVISVFNVLAFVIFLNEKRARELFLFKALGMSQKFILKTWFKAISLLWVAACAGSIVLVKIFNYILVNVSFFELPGEVYNMGRVSISLEVKDYILVFSLSFLWLMIISWIGLRRTRKRSILQGLRKEFA